MARCRFAMLFALALGCSNAGAQDADSKIQSPPPAPMEDCKDCFGLAAPRPVPPDYSYAPLLDSKPFGEQNCGTTASNPMEPSLLRYEPFVRFMTGTWLKHVAFAGAGESAISCMILLARVQEKRLEASGGMRIMPTTYKWKLLLLKYDPRSGEKLIWVPVTPNAQEQADSEYLPRTAKRMLGSLGTPLEELYAQHVQLTTGFKDNWVTLILTKDESGAVVQTITQGMGPPGSIQPEPMRIEVAPADSTR